MSPSQFSILVAKLDDIERRVRRVEIWSATAGGAITVIGFLIQQHVLKLGG